MLLELCLSVVLLYILYQFIRKAHSRFDGTGVPHRKTVPILGDFWRSTLGRQHFFHDMGQLYDGIGDERCRYVGAYSFWFPGLIIKDPMLIKQITVKDFDFFSEHENGFHEDVEPVLGKSLIALKGQKWRDMRSTLSPVFTSSKIKDICPFASECGKQLSNYLESQCEENLKINGEAFIELEVKELSSRFTTDVIASTIFGIEVDSFKNKNNDFFVMGKIISKFGIVALINMVIAMVCPRLALLLKLRLFDPRMDPFFRDLVLSAMKYRLANNIVRRDMIQLLMEAKQGSLKHEKQVNPEGDAGFAIVEESEIGTREHKRVWDDDDLVAQTALFFFAGFETVSTLACFLLHELAVNPEVQEKLRHEVDENMKDHGINISYEMIQKMKYMDMVVSEGLRKWPPNGVADRQCVKDIDLGPVRENERTSYTIKKGEVVWFPTYSLHRDEKYWSDPEKFDPERFSEENKHKILPFVYLPFGAGPRNCIGSRFALMEAKVFLYHLLAKYKLEICSKTTNPIILDNKSFLLQAKHGFWLKFVKIN